MLKALVVGGVKQRENLAGRNGLAYRKRGPKTFWKRPKNPALLYVLGPYFLALYEMLVSPEQ